MTSYRPNPNADGTLAVQYLINGESSSGASAVEQAVAQNIVDNYTSEIKRFVQVNRQFGQISSMGYQARTISPPGMDISYSRNGKQEILKLNVKPAQLARPSFTLETNYDGYFGLMVYFKLKGNSSGPDPTFKIKVNKKEIYTTPSIKEHDYVFYLVTFGATALICQSVNDGMNPVTNNQNGLACQPPLPKVSGRPDAFGYFFADWTAKTNPAFVDHFWDNFDLDPPGNPLPDGSPDLRKILWYSDVSKSPLNMSGDNDFRIEGGNIGDYYITCAWGEFYSRSNGKDQAPNDYHLLTSTWDKAATNNAVYYANNKPLTCYNVSVDDQSHTSVILADCSIGLSTSTDHSDNPNNQDAGADYSALVIGKPHGAGSGKDDFSGAGSGSFREFDSYQEYASALRGG